MPKQLCRGPPKVYASSEEGDAPYHGPFVLCGAARDTAPETDRGH